MEQFFAVTVRENNSGALVYNTSAKPEELEKLDITNLSAGMSYIATVSKMTVRKKTVITRLKKSLSRSNFSSVEFHYAHLTHIYRTVFSLI